MPAQSPGSVFNHTCLATNARAVRGFSLINGAAAHYLNQETPELGDALRRLAIDRFLMRTRREAGDCQQSAKRARMAVAGLRGLAPKQHSPLAAHLLEFP
jgi:hypothetical protein